MVLPGSGKSFEQFRADDYQCRQFALNRLAVRRQIGPPPASRRGKRCCWDRTWRRGGGGDRGRSRRRDRCGWRLAGRKPGGRGHGSSSAGSVAQQRSTWAIYNYMYANGHRVPVSGRIMYNSPPIISGAQNSSYSIPLSAAGKRAISGPPPPPGNPLRLPLDEHHGIILLRACYCLGPKIRNI